MAFRYAEEVCRQRSRRRSRRTVSKANRSPVVLKTVGLTGASGNGRPPCFSGARGEGDSLRGDLFAGRNSLKKTVAWRAWGLSSATSDPPRRWMRYSVRSIFSTLAPPCLAPFGDSRLDFLSANVAATRAIGILGFGTWNTLDLSIGGIAWCRLLALSAKVASSITPEGALRSLPRCWPRSVLENLLPSGLKLCVLGDHRRYMGSDWRQTKRSLPSWPPLVAKNPFAPTRRHASTQSMPAMTPRDVGRCGKGSP